uniref:Pept_C1 domain-containing protein n=1 Tax=Panagrellus redivivus TaxID=6233 RepID=A0A7E4V661_PANRE
MNFWMAAPRSSKQNLLEGYDGEQKKQTETTLSSITSVLFQGSIIFIGCFLLFVGAHYAANQLYDKASRSDQRELPQDGLEVNDAADQFKSLINQLNITYNSQNELIDRFKIFSKNLKHIRQAQSDSENVIFGVNRFTLMSDDELRAYIMPSIDVSATLSTILAETERVDAETNPLPTRPGSLDWRSRGVVTRVKNQGNCGSCWAFGVTASIESLFAIRGRGLQERSEQELVDCDRDNGGCNGGTLQHAFGYIKDHGQTLERLYTYKARQEGCRQVTAEKVRISGYKSFPRDENYLADWVAANGPVTIAICVTREFYSYKRGVFNPSNDNCQHHCLGGHALAIVGYGNEGGSDYWLLKNSWDTSFGDHGYIKMKRGVNSCGIGEWAVAPIP